jgi:hypothetical protein
MSSSFNASVAVTELLTKTLENVSKDLASRCIKECGLRYGFNSDEAIRELGLENLTLLKKKMSRKSVSVSSSMSSSSNDKKEKKEKKLKEKEEKEEKSKLPMPFVGKSEDNTVCSGLAFNRGLFTQCLKKHMENGSFCKGCQSEADKNASGCPDCGTVESRLNTGLYEFKDPKGRSPVSYIKVLNKMNVSCSQAIEEAKKMGFEIPEEHLVEKEKADKSISRGRPKKVSSAVEAENVTDLFKKLSFDNAVIEDTDDTEEPIKEKAVKAKLSDEEKAAKREALEKEREAKKEEREMQRKAEVEQKKKEREEKLASEKKVREEKLAEEKAEREAKRKAEKEAKGAKAEEKTTQKKVKKSDNKDVTPVANPVVNPVPTVVTDVVPVEEKTKTTVTRIQISGKQYLKSSANILYDPDTKEEVGLWNPITKKIEELPEDEDEEEEEEDEYE